MACTRSFRLVREQRVDRPLERVFPFFERPENLALITPPSLGFRLLTPLPVEMEQGRLIDYKIRVLGLRIRWRSLISTYQPPHCFVDEQVIGPYARWHHTHRFENTGSGTRLIDEVHYALPSVLPDTLAMAIQRWYLQPELQRIFDFRRDQFHRLFGGPDPSPFFEGTEINLEN